MFAGEIAGQRAARDRCAGRQSTATHRRCRKPRRWARRSARPRGTPARCHAGFQAGAIRHLEEPVNSTPSARSRTSAAPSSRSSRASRSPKPARARRQKTKRTQLHDSSLPFRCPGKGYRRASRNCRVSMRYASMSKRRAPGLRRQWRNASSSLQSKLRQVLPAVDDMELRALARTFAPDHRPLVRPGLESLRHERQLHARQVHRRAVPCPRRRPCSAPPAVRSRIPAPSSRPNNLKHH